jgi:hypothetical protein
VSREYTGIFTIDVLSDAQAIQLAAGLRSRAENIIAGISIATSRERTGLTIPERPGTVKGSALSAFNKASEAETLSNMAETLESIPVQRVSRARHALLDQPVTVEAATTQVKFTKRNRNGKWTETITGATREQRPFNPREGEVWVEKPDEELPIISITREGQCVVFGGHHIGWIFKESRSTKWAFILKEQAKEIDARPQTDGYGGGTGRQAAAQALAKRLVDGLERSLRTLSGARAGQY